MCLNTCTCHVYDCDCLCHVGVLVVSSYIRTVTIAVAAAIEIRAVFCPSVVTICHIVRCRFLYVEN